MTIGLDDLDETIAKVLIETLDTIAPPRSPTAVRATALKGLGDIAADGLGDVLEGAAVGSGKSEDRRKELTPEQKALVAALSKHRWFGAGWRSFVPVGAAFAAVMAGTQLESQPWLMGGLFGLSFLFSGIGFWRSSRRDLMAGFRTHLPSEVLVAAIPLMGLCDSEAIYLHSTLLLNDLHDRVGEQTARNVLGSLNELLSSSRQLELQRHRLTEAIEQNSSAVLESDRARFTQRLSEIDDPASQKALQQSLRMCESRLQDTQVMEQNLQRVTVQQEAMHQTLASAHSALVRMQTTPSLGSPAVEELTEAVSQINMQTQAVEQAVQEVASLTAQN